MSDIALQAVSLLSNAFADLAIVGSDKANFRPKLTERMVLAYLLNPANVTNNVTQFGDSWTIAGKSFVATGQVLAVAAQFGQLQLVNPPGSGFDAMVDLIKPVIAGNFIRYAFGVADIAAGGAAWTAAGVSRDLQGAPGATHMLFRSNTVAALPGTELYRHFNTTDASNYVGTMPPLRVPPGATLTMQDGLANDALSGRIEYREVAHV